MICVVPLRPLIAVLSTMPDKTLKVVTYAAGASLAAITLIYVFGPTYFLDSQRSGSLTGTFSTRKKGAVGLANPANDCFINSVLQALAGLGDLRVYLIHEIHRRSLDDDSVYSKAVPPGRLVEDDAELDLRRFGKDIPAWKLEGLQRGSITQSLKDILDALNERPIYSKTISAAPFLRALEEAFRQRISRQQQDAQEFLQVVAERLCDEYHAGRRARLFAHRAVAANDGLRAAVGTENHSGGVAALAPPGSSGPTAASDHTSCTAGDRVENYNGMEEKRPVEDDEGFPLQGKFESQIECLTCGFSPRPTTSTFCTLTLHVPQLPATTLGACFDGMFKTEYIDDFKCEKCRLLHALALSESERQRSTSEADRAKAQVVVDKLRAAIEVDPEHPPEGVALPDLRHAPRRRIARHIRMTEFPKILAIHLSRSIFDVSRSSQKNSGKVVFSEELPLGGLLQQRKYKLLGVVTHKGSHHSGHYESFRRQNLYPPYSNPSTFQASGVYSRTGSPAPTLRVVSDGTAGSTFTGDTLSHQDGATSVTSPVSRASPVEGSPPHSIRAGSPVKENSAGPSVTRSGAGNREECIDAATPRFAEASPSSSSLKLAPPSAQGGVTGGQPATNRHLAAPKSKQRKPQARWWRISDDKVKEASTRDVLAMQREVYLLFYELERSRTLGGK